MFALARTAGNVSSFEFGSPVDPALSLEEEVRWIMADYENRRDDFLDVSVSQSVAMLIRFLMEAVSEPAKMTPLIRALGFLRSPNSAASLASLLTYPSKDVQCETISSLGRIASLEELPSIEPFLTADDRELRRAAIIALGRSPDPDVFSRMTAAAREDPELRALVDQGRRRFEAFQSRDQHAYVEAVIETEEYEDLMRLMEVSADYVLAILADSSREPIVRARAARLVGLVRLRRAGEQLAEILADPGESRDVQLHTVIAAGRCRARTAVPSLVRLLSSPDAMIEESAITALGRIRAPETLEPLLAKWDDRGGSLRQIVLLALSRFAVASGTDLLRRLLRENQAWTPDLICFIDESLRLSRNYEPDLLDKMLHSFNAEARRDAILLMAFLATREKADELRRMVELESDIENRQLAGLALAKLEQS